MIDLETIEREINELENRRDTTYALCQRLSWLYVVRDHLLPRPEDERTARLGGSEFLKACSNVPYEKLMTVLDEHMETLRLLYPKSYDTLLDKIRAII